MAERLRTQQNWEERNYISLGPKFRIDTVNPQMGIDGTNVYNFYGVTDSGDQNVVGLTEGGHFRILNDRSIEITAGNKSESEGVDIALNSLNGSISLTAIGNGSVQIKARNIILDASEDVDIKAGRNMTLTAGMTMKLDAMKIEVDGLFGNLIETVLGTFASRVFEPTGLLGASIGIGGGGLIGGVPTGIPGSFGF